MAAAQHVIRTLAPVTLVNLSNLCGWLFATATMPAVVLFARHRPQRPDQVTVVQIPWTSSGARTHSFEISPSDIIKLSQSEIEKQPLKLKAAAIGRHRDIQLLDTLCSANAGLGGQLNELGAKFSDGLKYGKPVNQTKNSTELVGLEILQATDLQSFFIKNDLGRFEHAKIEAPRTRSTFRAPLIVVKEMMGDNGRALVATAERDILFTDSYFAASIPPKHSEVAHLVSAILGSSLASWFFLMTASEFGIWKRKLLIRDVIAMPTPNLKLAIKSSIGKKLLLIEKNLQMPGIDSESWELLDETVFDLYELDFSDRVVVRDGLFRASWQWKAGRDNSVASADVRTDIVQYTEIFLNEIGGWLSARNKRHMRAEIFDLPNSSALRVVRFVLEDGIGEATVKMVKPEGELNDVLAGIGKRLKVKLATALSGERELRIHGRNEVIIIKPAARRYWMGIAALEDADAVIAESFTGGNA